jgi:C4-dicarboxylate transporter DctQ subunit
MKNFSSWVFRVEKAIGGILLLMMLCFVFFATIGRYTGWYNMAWSDEASRYCMIWSVFLLAGLSAFRGEMFSIDIVSEKLPLKGQKAFVIIRLLLMAAFCAFAIIYGGSMMAHQVKIHQLSPSLKIPMYFMYSSVPVGCALLLAHYVALAWVQLNEINKKILEGGNK